MTYQMHKLTPQAHNWTPEVKGITDFGNFNSLPQPCVEMTEDEYWHLKGLECAQAVEFRQVSIHPGKPGEPARTAAPFGSGLPMKQCYIEFFHTFALVVVKPSAWRLGDTEKGEHFTVFSERPRFFRCAAYQTPEWVKQEGTAGD